MSIYQDRVYVVPGIGESTLIDTTFLQTVIWVGIPTIALGYFGAIRLAPNGVDPGPPDGIPLNVGGPIPIYIQQPTYQLADQMRYDDMLVLAYSWDWRKSILDAGDALATSIRQDLVFGNKISLVGHSAGGLVCRRAWSSLLATGDQALVRRIITLGTPHWGSYYAHEAFAGLDSITHYLRQINNTIGAGLGITEGSVGYKIWTDRQIADLLLTFPSLYELLPVVGAPDGVTDPLRPDLFVAANWGGGTYPQQSWLDHARTTYRDWVLSPASMPPNNVMTTVSSVGYGTPSLLANLTRLGEAGALGGFVDGDSVVFPGSALLADSLQINVSGQHSNQVGDHVTNGNIRRWILDNRALAPSPVPPVTLPALQPALLPPVPGVLATGTAAGPSNLGSPTGLCGPGH